MRLPSIAGVQASHMTTGHAFIVFETEKERNKMVRIYRKVTLKTVRIYTKVTLHVLWNCKPRAHVGGCGVCTCDKSVASQDMLEKHMPRWKRVLKTLWAPFT